MAHKKGLLKDLARLYIPVFQQEFKLHRSEAKNFSLGVSDVFVTYMTCVWCHLNFSNFRLFQAWVSFFFFFEQMIALQKLSKMFLFYLFIYKGFFILKIFKFLYFLLPFFFLLPIRQPLLVKMTENKS